MSKYKEINLHLLKIQNSQCFSKSVVLKELLTFLIKKSAQGEIPKEVEIAYEVFGKKQNQGKEKNIRIYVYNLRKKLKEYYEKEGVDDEVIFSIPKGGYEVEIKSNSKQIVKSRLAKASPFLLATSIFLIILTAFVFSGNQRPKVTRSFIWNEIYNSDFPLLIILGDHYFLNQRNILGNMAATRFNEINSNSDFDQMIEQTPELAKDLKKTEQTYINKQAPFGLYKVMSFLGGGSLEIDMRYSSDLQWEHLKNNNTLFIGSYKTQDILKDIFEKIGIRFIVRESKVEYTVNDSTIVFSPQGNEFLSREFASLIHFETTDGRIVMALMCNTDMGNIATVKHLSEPKNLKTLKQLTTNFPNSNFMAVFEVKGQQQTDFEIHLKRIDPIMVDINEIWP